MGTESTQWSIANWEWNRTNQSCTVHFTEVGPKQEKKKSPNASGLGRHHRNATVRQILARQTTQQRQTAICLSGFNWEKRARDHSTATGKTPRSCESCTAPCVRFPSGTALSAVRCSQQSRNSCTMQAASEWPESFLFRPRVIWGKKKNPLVFFCALQRQYFSGSKFKTQGLLGEARWTMY